MDQPRDEQRAGGSGNGRGAPPPQDDTSLLARFKEFALTSFAVDHTTSSVVLLVIIAITGMLAYGAIPKESFPEIEIPMIAVSTIYPGVSPSDIEDSRHTSARGGAQHDRGHQGAHIDVHRGLLEHHRRIRDDRKPRGGAPECPRES